MKGEKRTLVAYGSVDKTTHSYTTQYIVTLGGKLLPFVFLCTRGTNCSFGPRVQTTIKKLITCSKSGKLSTALYRDYLEKVLKPYVKEEFPLCY